MRRGRLAWVPTSEAAETAPGLRALPGAEAPSVAAAFAADAKVTAMPVHDPPLAPRDEAIFLLHTASEIEHALLVQYLYAAYSLKRPEEIPDDDPAAAARRGSLEKWRALILQTAREEMGHLITLQNLLRLIGGPLNFEREDMPFRTDFYPFQFRLEPLTKTSLARYILAEKPAQTPGVLSDAEVEEMRERVLGGAGAAGEPVNRVGSLFAKLLELVDALPEIVFAADVGPWQADVGEWGRGAVAIERDPQNGRITAVGEGVLVMPTRNKAEALDALQAIAVQGEAASTESGAVLTSHFRRFLAIYQDPDFPDERVEPPWRPVRDVPHDPNTAAGPQPDPETEAGRLDGRARLWAQALNLRYRMLLADLSHALHLTRGQDSPRGVLRDWTFREMFLLRDISELLVTLPRREDAPDGPRAGPPFELPYTLALPDNSADRWRLHEDLIRASESLRGRIREAGAPGNETTLLEDLEQADASARREIGGRLGRIVEIRIFPPLALARFGSAAEPMDNYEVRPGGPDGFGTLVPAETLRIHPETGAIAEAFVPDAVRFRGEEERIRPVAPFLEVWARFEEGGPFEPLTTDHLERLGLGPDSVHWRVHVANRKIWRRTSDPGDIVTAEIAAFSDHAAHDLSGTARNFKVGKSVPFGSVRYVRPTPEFPEIRLRFTPGPGRVYGHTPDPNVADDVYDAGRGGWQRHVDDTDAPTTTLPVLIYAQNASGVSRGYLDDACDGIVEAQIDAGGGATLTARARISSGPPDFAPDSFLVRTVADELEQMLRGPEVTETVEAAAVIDIIERALETVRLMNPDFLNRRVWGGPFPAAKANYAHVRERHADVLRNLGGLAQPPGTPERNRAVDSLRLMLSQLRQFTQVMDNSVAARRLMPALMRGADGRPLALTRRQRATVAKAIQDFAQPSTPQQPGGGAERDMVNLIVSLQDNAFRHQRFEVDGDQRLSDLFQDPSALLNYLRTATVRGTAAPPALQGRPLVVPGDPEASAFVALLQVPDHPMNEPFQGLDSSTGKIRIDIVRDWIRSLPAG